MNSVTTKGVALAIILSALGLSRGFVLPSSSRRATLGQTTFGYGVSIEPHLLRAATVSSPVVADAEKSVASKKPGLADGSSSGSNDDVNVITTNELFSSIIHAAIHGSNTIRSLRERVARDGPVEFKEEGEARSALTIADTAAQRVIVSSLTKKYPSLRIVGEEDGSVDVETTGDDDEDDDDDAAEDLNEELIRSLHLHLPEELLEANMDPPETLDIKEIVLYVDPLDGTREFVEGRLDNVQCLIGVCYKGRPLMGAMGLPFPDSGEGDLTEVVFGLVGGGVGKAAARDGGEIAPCPLPAMKRYDPEIDAICISSGDSAGVRPAVDLAQTVFESAGHAGGIERQIAGACGNKLLRCLDGTTTLSIQHDKTSLWDTAAPTAVLSALGGMVTDYFGDELVYDASRVLGNELGVVASAPGAQREHRLLVNAMRGDEHCLSVLEKYGLKNDQGSGAQCVDIVRDLSGYPLPVSYFAEKLNIEHADAYSCPETESFRGLMSNACRVHLFPGGETVFYKRIVFEQIEHARNKLKFAPYKLVSDVESYKVVTAFISSKACRAVTEKAGVHIPKCYDVQLEPNDSNPIESKFSFLIEDLSKSDGWSQRWLLQDLEECKAALSTYAKIHAFFWDGSSFWDDADAAGQLETGVWKSGSYVQPNRNLGQCENVARGWATSRLKYEKELSSFDYWDNLGDRLESTAVENGRLAHPFADDALSESYKKYRTFTHGDPKQANLLFRHLAGSEIEVGLIDFQWSGFGLAATDIAHFMTSAVHADRLVDGGEDVLLKYYYAELQKYLVEFGAARNSDDAIQSFKYDMFMEQYETGVLDICRLVIAYVWKRFERVDEDDSVGRARTMNKTSYNKSMRIVAWLMSRCDEILTSRGV